VDEERARIQRAPVSRPTPEPATEPAHRLTVLAPLAGDGLSYIRNAIDCLATQPAASELVEQLVSEPVFDWSNLAKARRWLDDLARSLDQRWPLMTRAGSG
jgi:hypothetical protein